MELKRKYREAPSISTFKLKLIKLLRKLKPRDTPEPEVEYELKENGWWRRNVFSLTGLYYNLFKYGESLERPALFVIFPFLLGSILLLLVADGKMYIIFIQF